MISPFTWSIKEAKRQREGTFERTVGEIAMREKWLAVRDTMVVLSMQIIFRSVMILRRLNY
jgi:hypothetical protein